MSFASSPRMFVPNFSQAAHDANLTERGHFGPEYVDLDKFGIILYTPIL